MKHPYYDTRKLKTYYFAAENYALLRCLHIFFCEIAALKNVFVSTYVRISCIFTISSLPIIGFA